MLIEFCTMLGACMLGATILALVLQCYISITDKIKQKKKIITLNQYENITYNNIEYKIISKKVKVRRIEHKPLKINERQIKEKNKYYDYY